MVDLHKYCPVCFEALSTEPIYLHCCNIEGQTTVIEKRPIGKDTAQFVFCYPECANCFAEHRGAEMFAKLVKDVLGENKPTKD